MSLLNTSVSGVTVPTAKYINSIGDDFPSENRTYKVESSISSRYQRDHLPLNANISTGNISDSYVEFIVSANQNEFIDLDSLTLETKLKITKADGSSLDDTCKVSVVDGLAHRLFIKSSIFLNGISVENTNYYGIYNMLKTYLSMGKHELSSAGRNSYYKDIGNQKILNTFTEANFASGALWTDEKEIINDCKTSLHFITPLNLDISSANFLLLNSVDIRLRFDLAPPACIINSPDLEQYRYNITSMKLWSQKIVPYPSALMSLSKALINGNSTIDYIFKRPVIKHYIFPQGHTNIVLDNVFNGLIPNTLYVFFMHQSNLNGSYERNGAFLTHGNISNLLLEINGNTYSSLSGSFPDQVAHMLNQTLSNIKGDNHLLTLRSFKEGRTIHTFDLRTSDCEDVLSVEKSGNVRISLNAARANTENLSVFIVGMTTGLLEIDAHRRVRTSYLM